MTEDFVSLKVVHHSSLVQPTEAFLQASSPPPLYNKVISDKHEDLMARFGAALGRGFIDAGSCNVTISLHWQSRVESRNTSSMMIMFCQFWYWYLLAHCACLAFEPTAIIPLNADLKVSLDS
jgi:26S proteasome regulatory subunit N2